MSNKRDNSALAPILLIGLAAGAAAWYLLKTEKGRETKDTLLDTFNELSNTFKEKASDSINQVTEQAKTVIDNLKARTSNV
ncbi:YtxH domain-containing protein [Daejeonella oryzae]|uniref:YtxH domain-containing protein n=1 Tax=Daejeonella oryzae TaxID=1122943 RepID=UPI0004123FFF|nr:YtxH domain-containing protein [Daejeonella oryzae]